MSDDLFLCQVSKESAVRGELKKEIHLGYHGNGRPFDFFQPRKNCHSLMKGIQQFLKSPFVCFHGNCGKVCPTDSIFFGLFLSTRCGCCSYQVSLISGRRVTCFDHFCVFSTRQKLPHTTVNIATMFHEVWWKKSIFF